MPTPAIPQAPLPSASAAGRSRHPWSALLASLLAPLAAAGLLLTVPPAQAHGGLSIGVVIGSPPPPPRYQPLPPPRPGQLWSPGYWAWDGYRYVWLEGRWLAARPGYAYVPGRWEQRPGGWMYYGERWRPAPQHHHYGPPHRHHDGPGRGPREGHGGPSHFRR